MPSAHSLRVPKPIQVFKGSVKVEESDEVIPTFHTVVLSSGEGETGVRLTAVEDNTELVLVRIISHCPAEVRGSCLYEGIW